MRKLREIDNSESCLNKALADEMLFVLRGHDIAAPATIRFWILERIRLGKIDNSLVEALHCAETMEKER